jgi:hypothetical protein
MSSAADAERRSAGRCAYADGHLPPAARIRPGTPVIVVNLSERGVLVEAGLRCKPGARCEVAIALDEGETVVRARVVRCFVARLTAATVRYRTALAFERPVAPPSSPLMATGYEVPVARAAATTTGVVSSHSESLEPTARGDRRPNSAQSGERPSWHRP